MPNAIRSIQLQYGPIAGPHSLDLYYHPQSSPAKSPLIVFVHGGAWWTEDKSDHAQLATQIAQRTACVVAVVNYRLSLHPPLPPGVAQIHHPEHANDVLAALTFLRNSPPTDQAEYDPSDIILMGHSCGAHILTSLFLQPPASPSSPGSPSSELIASVKGILLSEGIFDVGLLLSKFPSYVDFVSAAFSPSTLDNPSDPMQKAIATPTYQPRPNSSHIHWKILHSMDDALIDVGQPDAMYNRLSTLTDKVSKDYESLKGDHDDLLKRGEIVDVVESFVRDVLGDVWNIDAQIWVRTEREMFSDPKQFQ